MFKVGSFKGGRGRLPTVVIILLAVAAASASFVIFAPGSSGEVTSYLDDDGSVYLTGEGTFNGSFQGNKNVLNVFAGNSVTSIGPRAFSECTSLESVSLPGVRVVGDGAFSGCSSLKSMRFYGYTSIGSNAFLRCTSLESVIVGGDVGSSAFYGCTSLESVNVGGDVGSSAFYGCTSLLSVSLSGATSIEVGAFRDCTSLSSVSMPNVKSISIGYYSSGAFQDCTSLSSVSLPSATSIGGYTFSGCTSLSSVSLPRAKYIGDYAFSGCTSLSSVSLPRATDIWDRAFWGCTSLSRVTVPSNMPMSLFNDSHITKLTLAAPTGTGSRGSLKNLDALTSLTVEEGVRSIGAGEFNGCTSLEYAYLADSVEAIGDMAFCGCTGLARFHSPASLASVGDMAFHKVTFLDVDGVFPISPGSEKFRGGWFEGENGVLTRAVDPFDGQAFARGGLVFTVVSADRSEASVTGCADGATSLSVPSKVWHGARYFKVVSVADRAFYGNGSLASADLGKVPVIGSKAFAKCTALESVSVGGDVKSYAFYGCPSLKAVVLSKGVRSVGAHAFGGCSGVEVLSVASTVSTVGEDAFRGLRFLDGGQDLDASAENLSGNLFEGCGKALRLVRLHPGDVFESGGLKYKVTAVAPLRASLDGYEEAPIRLVVPETVEYGGFRIQVTSVGREAFKDCPSLVSVDLVGVGSVGLKAFANCTQLRSLSCGAQLRSLGDYAFYGCTSLSSVDISAPDGTVEIGQYCFFRCGALSTISFPDSMSVGDLAFGYLKFYDGRQALSATAGDLAGRSFAGTNRTLSLVSKPVDGAAFTYSGLRYVVTSAYRSEAALVGREPGTSAVEVPDLVYFGESGFLVTSVPDRAFYDDQGLVSVDLGPVREVGLKAFARCAAVKALSMPCVESVGGYAFYGCGALESVAFSGELSLVGPSAFSVRFLRGSSAVSGADALRGLEFTGSDGTLRAGASPTVGETFESGGLRYMVTSADPAEASVTGCADGVGRLVIPGTVRHGEFDFAVVSVGPKAFYSRDAIVSADLGGVRGVGAMAFAGCTGLRSVSMGSVEYIGDGAFQGCAALERVRFSSALATVGESPFSVGLYCDGEPATEAKSLRGVEFAGSGGVLHGSRHVSLGEAFVSGGLTYEVTSVYPLEVSLSDHAADVRRLFVPDSVNYNGVSLSVTSVGPRAFYGCKALETADLGPVREVASKAFANCDRLAAVIMPSVEAVGDYAFYGCSAISVLDLSSVESIGAQAFRGLSGLEFVRFSDGLTEVGQNAFHSVRFYRDGAAVQRTADGLRGHSFSKADGVLSWES